MMNYLITINDIYDSIYYVQAETDKKAIIKLADYFDVTIKFIDNIIDNMSVEDIVNLFAHYNLDIDIILKVDDYGVLYGSISENNMITVIN